MSNLSAFLHPVQRGEEEIIISDRFVERDASGAPMRDKAGNPVLAKFRIRPVTQAENEKLIKAATKKKKVNGKAVDELDKSAYTNALIISGTVSPDFRSSELCEAYGVLDPSMVPSRMLYVGEYNRLVKAISQLSGITEDELQAVEEEAKN